jgi:hypothetical protein
MLGSYTLPFMLSQGVGRVKPSRRRQPPRSVTEVAAQLEP